MFVAVNLVVVALSCPRALYCTLPTQLYANSCDELHIYNIYDMKRESMENDLNLYQDHIRFIPQTYRLFRIFCFRCQHFKSLFEVLLIAVLVVVVCFCYFRYVEKMIANAFFFVNVILSASVHVTVGSSHFFCQYISS